MRKLPKLTPRLGLVARMVRPGGVVADIGTDHAYLPVYLVLSGNNPSAYACDVREGPLARAKSTVEEYGVSESVRLILTDGLEEVPKADDVILAGMGGELIAQIIAPCAFLRSPGVSLVLQPMSAAEDLRLFLCRAGFSIQREAVAREGTKLYDVMAVAFTGNCFEPDPVYCRCGELPAAMGPDEEAYLGREVSRLREKARGLRRSASHSREAEEAEGLALRIEERIQMGV